jgi:cytochrome c5
MHKRIVVAFAIVFLVLLLGSLFTACGGATREHISAPTAEEGAPSALDGKSLVEERCTQCHDLGRVEQAKKTAEEWKATVERMVGKGAQLNQAEQEVVIQYLAETYPK